jgi:ubiquinone/menaquinone biosynthesis C-methylase UbiE
MKPESVPMLRCPRSHEPLRLVSEPGPDGRPQQVLVSEPSGERYLLRDGIPLLLDQDAVSGLNQRYQGAYNKAARLYDPALRLVARLVGGSEQRFRREYLQELGVQAGQRVLEVSVGTGANLRYLPPAATYFGLDISWGMLARCRDNLRKWQLEAELFLGNAEELPFCDESFDVIYHVGGINAFNDRARALAEMVRVARNGSRLLVVDETAKMMESLSWMPSVKRMLQQDRDRFQAPVEQLPSGMVKVQVTHILRGWLYCMTFRKP